MNTFTLIVLCLAVVVSVNAQCSSSVDCSSCLNDASCVWCHSTSTCVEGDYTGPTNYTCPDYAYFTCSEHNVQYCSQYSNCSACTDLYDNLNCAWCPASNSCMSVSEANATCSLYKIYGCESCADYQNCSICSATTVVNVNSSYVSCGWCNTSSTCTEGSVSGPLTGSCSTWDYLGSCGGGVLTDICTFYTACEYCALDSDCGWCISTSTCVSGTSTGPSTGSCPNWDYSGTTCPSVGVDCADFTDCGLCAGFGDCGWCASSNTCAEGSSNGPTNGTCTDWDYAGSTCQATDCSEYTACDECTLYSNCGWCSSSNKCVAGDDSGPDSGSCSSSKWFYEECPEYCVPIEGTSTFCPNLPAKTCSESSSVQASDYSETDYEIEAYSLSLYLCPSHPDSVNYTQSDYCNVYSCSSSSECQQEVDMMPMCWDLCLYCNADSTATCSTYVSFGIVAAEGDTDCAETFDELFNPPQGNGAGEIRINFLMCAVLAILIAW